MSFVSIYRVINICLDIYAGNRDRESVVLIFIYKKMTNQIKTHKNFLH
jgi:hypothetical protein